MTRRPTAAPDYTNAFLATMGLILFMGFFTLAAIGGTLWVALGAVTVDIVIKWIDRQRNGAPSLAMPPPDDR